MHSGSPEHAETSSTNDSGQVVWQWKYSGFGEDQPTTAKTRFAETATNPNPGTTNLTVPQYNLRYAGQYFDQESGLHYNGYRTYDPRVGGYTQNDPIGLEGGWNRRVYVEGNPLGFIDAEGLQARDLTRRPTDLSLLEGGAGGGRGDWRRWQRWITLGIAELSSDRQERGQGNRASNRQRDWQANRAHCDGLKGQCDDRACWRAHSLCGQEWCRYAHSLSQRFELSALEPARSWK